LSTGKAHTNTLKTRSTRQTEKQNREKAHRAPFLVVT